MPVTFGNVRGAESWQEKRSTVLVLVAFGARHRFLPANPQPSVALPAFRFLPKMFHMKQRGLDAATNA
jgi:hypothetical protein